MARNAIQFKKRAERATFLKDYGAEVQCLVALEALRWPEGLVCPACGRAKSHRLHSRPRLHGESAVPQIAFRAVNSYTESSPPSAEVITDGLYFPFVIEAGCSHSVRVSRGARRKSVEARTFRWVKATLGNIKSALTGTYRYLSDKHVPRYLLSYNRRCDLALMLPRLARVCRRCRTNYSSYLSQMRNQVYASRVRPVVSANCAELVRSRFFDLMRSARVVCRDLS